MALTCYCVCVGGWVMVLHCSKTTRDATHAYNWAFYMSSYFIFLRALLPCYRVNPLELYLYYNFIMEAYIQAYIHIPFFSFLEMSLDYLLLHLLPLLTYTSFQFDSSYHIILFKTILCAHFTDPPLAAPSYALNNSLIVMGNPM